jgi:hypothetical protein
MEETRASNQQQALSTVERLKKLCLQEFGEYTLKEFHLQEETESLIAFFDLFFLKNGKKVDNCIIWITDNAFVSLSGCLLPGVYRDTRLRMWMHRLRKNPAILGFHSPTLEEAVSCLDLLAGLRDTHVQDMGLSNYVRGENELQTCPLPNRLLEKILLQNPERQHRFINMVFTAEQCRVLAATGTDIGFFSCVFEDGDAFVEESGPFKLRFYHTLPFNDEQFVLLLNQNKFELLQLYHLTLTENVYRAVVTAEIPYLDLFGSELEDGGAELVESVSMGRGPKGLSIGWEQFDSPERAISFCNALRGNTYLERLGILCSEDFRGDTPQGLAPALRENKGLTNLIFDGWCSFDNRSWSELMAAISVHPSLRMLKFEDILDANGDEPTLIMTRDRTNAVADMLKVNKQVDEMPFDDSTFDCYIWDKVVFPRLECNLYRKRLPALQKIQVPSTRAAIVTMALSSVASKPSLLWMILSQNADVLCSYLADFLTRNYALTVLSRKRSRSLFSEG